MKYLFKLNPYNQQRQFEKPAWVYPAHLAMYATHLKNEGHEIYWGENAPYIGMNEDGTNAYIPVDKIIEKDDQIGVPFEKLPFPDRKFTDAKNPRWQAYGNYRYHPATHMMASNLCWYGKCTFCIDTKKLNDGEPRGLRTVEHVTEEIDELISQGYKEVFDDSGTFPVGHWLEEFCQKMQEKERYKKIKVGCNMKPVKIDYKMMANAGFRFILVGIESANQYTLDTIKKGQKASDIIPIIKSMNDAGLYVHLTSMFGYEWETDSEAKKTMDLLHFLLRKGYAKTAQASVYSPPRTKADPNSRGHKWIPRVYDVYKHPEFIYRKIVDIRNFDDLKYLIRGARLVVEEKIRKMNVR